VIADDDCRYKNAGSVGCTFDEILKKESQPGEVADLLCTLDPESGKTVVARMEA
jgi:hypothetical protein